MTFACVVLAVIAVFGVCYAFYYRQQIKNIKEQIAFLNRHETNMRITGAQKTGCVAELTNELNVLIEQTTALRKEIAGHEKNLKDTIINLSHDIRTPLTSLDGYFQLLVKSETPEEQQQYVAIIRGRLSSLKEMLDELFTYAKLTNRAYEVELSPCAVNEILLSVLFSFYHDIKERGIEPQIEIPEREVLILGNEVALRRIFQNILKNCMEHGGKHLSIRLANPSGKVQICFENDCPSGADVDSDRIFDRFYKADSARSKTSTGLGLAIAKELVERLDGSITGGVQDGVFRISTVFCGNYKQMD